MLLRSITHYALHITPHLYRSNVEVVTTANANVDHQVCYGSCLMTFRRKFRHGDACTPARLLASSPAPANSYGHYTIADKVIY